MPAGGGEFGVERGAGGAEVGSPPLLPHHPKCLANLCCRWGHNVASEHVANIRGGHPWIHQFGEASVAKYQNPYFMMWHDAVEQWKVKAA